jgi:hypothetical protein
MPESFLAATHPLTGERAILLGDDWHPLDATASHPNGARAYLVRGQWLRDDIPATQQPSLTARLRNALDTDNVDAYGRPKYGTASYGISDSRPHEQRGLRISEKLGASKISQPYANRPLNAFSSNSQA